MENWTELDLINGWIAEEDDPPRYCIEGNQVMVVGSAIAADPELPCARFPRELRPPIPVSADDAVGEMIVGWTIEPDGFLYLWQKHILEGL